MSKKHFYTIKLEWTGNTGSGTRDYKSYSRNHNVSIESKPTIECSSDPAFRGDPTKYNPEELLLAAIANCHLLWFLHLAANHKIVIAEYTDLPTAVMLENKDGSGRFSEVTLNPVVTVLCSQLDKAETELIISQVHHIHKEANRYCFIANSVNFPVRHCPQVKFVSV